jgi:tRNA-splicing ligase RtcB
MSTFSKLTAYEVGKHYLKMVDYEGKAVVKAWSRGVEIQDEALNQARDVALLPFVEGVALMPDAHAGIGATVGSVIASRDAVCPSIVGVDIGCGMRAIRLKPISNIVDDSELRRNIRFAIQKAVPHGRTDPRKGRDVGSWGNVPSHVSSTYRIELSSDYLDLIDRHPDMEHKYGPNQLGTLGTGNHFIEIDVDEEGCLWLVIHSGSRGPGNKVGTYFINRAKETMKKYYINLPNPDLAYFPRGTSDFADYLEAMEWAQRYALINRSMMAWAAGEAIESVVGTVEVMDEIDCHHNYVAWENFGKSNLLISRKGAIQARKGTRGIIPGARGAMSFIVEGLGNVDSYNSASHGAGRLMSRTEAKRTITLEQDEKACEGIECNRGAGLLDESKDAYKNIEDVMNAQKDLVRPIHTLRQIINIKGEGDGEQ